MKHIGEDNTKVVKFKGGLGNQLFQYTFLRNLELKYGFKVKGDFSYYNYFKFDTIRKPRILDLNVQIEIADENELRKLFLFNIPFGKNPKSFFYKPRIILEILFNNKYYFEKNRDYKVIEDIIHYKYFDGYWQSWKYVESIREILKKDLKLKRGLSEKNMNFINNISKEEAVFIGVRRGDYVNSKKAIKIYGVFNEEYYNKAIEIMKKKLKSPKFYVFSNDIDWVMKNMKFNEKVSFRTEQDQTSVLEELFVLGSFKHAIIPNSTFYWWGAWLIENDKKIVIAPNKWFANGRKIDIVPPSWLKL